MGRLASVGRCVAVVVYGLAVIAATAYTAPGAVLTVRAPDGRMVQVGIPNPAPPQLTIMFYLVLAGARAPRSCVF